MLIAYFLPQVTKVDDKLEYPRILPGSPGRVGEERPSVCAGIEFYELYLQSAIVSVYPGQMIYFKLDCIDSDKSTGVGTGYLDQERDMLMATHGTGGNLAGWRGSCSKSAKLRPARSRLARRARITIVLSRGRM